MSTSHRRLAALKGASIKHVARLGDLAVRLNQVLVQLDAVNALYNWLHCALHDAMVTVLAHETLLMLETLKELIGIGRVLTLDPGDAVVIAACVNLPDITALPLHAPVDR